MTAFHQAKGENPLAKRYQEIVDYIKEKIDYMQTNLLNTQLLFSTKYRTLHLNKM